MAIQPADIQVRLSGGSGNANPLTSIGGAKSSAVAPLGLFDRVTSTESGAGSVEYRCVYIHNAHATLTLENASAWLGGNTTSASTIIEIGLGSSAMNGTEQALGSETAAPAGVSFTPAVDKVTGIALGSIPPGQGRSLWFRRTVTAGAPASNDTAQLEVEGETVA